MPSPASGALMWFFEKKTRQTSHEEIKKFVNFVKFVQAVPGEWSMIDAKEVHERMMREEPLTIQGPVTVLKDTVKILGMVASLAWENSFLADYFNTVVAKMGQA